jgi:hypothetical protein
MEHTAAEEKFRAKKVECLVIRHDPNIPAIARKAVGKQAIQ